MGMVWGEENVRRVCARLRSAKTRAELAAILYQEVSRYSLSDLQAVRAALLRVESEVLKDHLDHCVMGAMTGDDPAERKAKANELIELLGRASR